MKDHVYKLIDTGTSTISTSRLTCCRKIIVRVLL